MKRSRFGALTAALALMMAMTLPVGAADLHEAHMGSACPAGFVGVWHFVNNQTGGAAAGTLDATFDGGTAVSTGPYKVLNNVQHFQISGGTVLDDASTDLPGMLVLSDFTCEEDKKPPVDDKK